MDIQTNRIKPSGPLTSKSKILARRDEEYSVLAKAIYDELYEGIQTKNLESNKELEIKLATLVGRLVGEQIGTWQRDWNDKLDRRLTDLEKAMKDSLLNFVSAIPPAQFILPDKSIEVNVPATIFNPQINVPKQDQPNIEVHVPQMKAPDVVVNQGNIDVHVPEQKQSIVNVQVPEQLAPIVNFTSPEQKTPIVNFTSPEVVVNVPKQEPSIVNVTVPEQKPADINITVPVRKTKKKVLYNEQGQPSFIEEVDS